MLKKTDSDRAEHQRKLERQARLLDARAAKIHKLEGLSVCHLSACLSSLLPSWLSVYLASFLSVWLPYFLCVCLPACLPV